MKIALVWYFPKASQIINNWRDGLRAALELIGKTHEVHWFLDREVPQTNDYDAIILWDDSNSGFFDIWPNYKGKKVMCLTTDVRNWDNMRMLDAVYCESMPIYEAVRAQGIRALLAFGTDTNFYKPKKCKKTIEYFYPATFSLWKRQSEIAYLGDKLYCIGTVQPDGEGELAKCLEKGVKVKNGYVPAREILEGYRKAKNVIIPAVHGSERTVLEAMACGIVPIVTHPENVRTYSYLNELKESGLTPREFILKNYSHVQYAKQIMKGIEE